MSRIIHYTYTRPGKGTETYEHWLVVDESDLKVMLMEDYRGRRLTVDDETVAGPGSALLWFVFPDRWYDIGRFHLADDSFTGWYTNLCTPVAMEGDRWASTDLFLDHWTSLDGRQIWLDEEELASVTQAGLLDEVTQIRIREERTAIQAHLDAGAWPPQVAIDLDLEKARSLLRG